ncbi:MAG: LacI family transcriptional regulator [Clostridiales bacterium]|nr:LacI family transcriptional regulator [Clostridiales bacterium]
MAATIADVAKMAGVGVGTVSRVLNGGKSVNESTKNAVLQAMNLLNYTPNSMAKRLREQKSKIIALMIPVVSHPFFAQFAECIEQEADKHKYSVLLVASQQRVQKESNIIERIKRREVDGAIFVTHFAHKPQEFSGCPLVSVDRHLADGIPFVTSDNYAATEKSVEYLISRGCKKIGYIGSKPEVESEVELREKAYRDVMKRHGMDECVVNEVITHGEENVPVLKFLENYGDADGVFAAGYSVANAFCKEAAKAGKKIPDDVQVVAYDGAFGSWSDSSSVTCVEQPVEQMARTAVDLLIKKIEGKDVPQKVIHESRFVVGTTTK